LETELADKYAQGELSARESEQFEQRFLTSEEGREQVAFARLMMDYAARETHKNACDSPNETVAQPETVVAAKLAKSTIVRFAVFRQAWANPYLKMAASLIIVAGLGLLVYRLFTYQSDVDKGLAALKKAYKTERPTEARITGFDYAPYTVTRG